jgi:hypothetical protein
VGTILDSSQIRIHSPGQTVYGTILWQLVGAANATKFQVEFTLAGSQLERTRNLARNEYARETGI